MFLTTGSDTACRAALMSEWEEGPVMADVQRRDGDDSEVRTGQADRCRPPAPDVTEAIAGALGERFAAMPGEERVRLVYHVQRLLSRLEEADVRRALRAYRDRNHAIEVGIMAVGIAVEALTTSPFLA
jgi:hypothetical protein